jgi:hypothetical protein
MPFLNYNFPSQHDYDLSFYRKEKDKDKDKGFKEVKG